jgi:hypothetical protein
LPLNKLDNFIKNTEGRILYVNPNDLDATDAITNQGNSLTQPFKTIQRAILEAARFSYILGNKNDVTEKTTILLFPGEHVIDNRPGYAIKEITGAAYGVSPGGTQSLASATFSLTQTSNFDLTQSENALYIFNSINGGVVVPRGTSIVGLDLRKTKLRPLYVPNPTDPAVARSAIFRITGACYFWQFSLFDANQSGLVYTNNTDFSANNQATPTFSHHKLTCFEYADGVNVPTGYTITDLDMYYAKVSNAFNTASGRDIPEKYPTSTTGFAKQDSEWTIVGSFATDPVTISAIQSGDGTTASTIVTVTTSSPHNLQTGIPIKINGVNTNDYNISTTVQNVISSTQFTYLLSFVRNNLPAAPSLSNGTVTIETDTVSGASPYIFNISLRSIWGMNGMHADGAKASGFRSMVVAQFTGVSLQKDDRAFVAYNQSSRNYAGINYTTATGALLASGSSSTDPGSVYHLNPDAIYRNGWESTHIKLSNDAFIQIVSVFAIGYTKHFEGVNGADASITNSNSNFGQNSITASGFKAAAFAKDDTAYVTSIVAPRAITNSSISSITSSNVSWVQIDVGLTTAVGISSHLYLFGFNSYDNPPTNIAQGYRIGANYNEQLYVTSKLNSANTNTANIYMVNNAVSVGTTAVLGTNTSEKKYNVSISGLGTVFSTSVTHNLQTGESIRMFSDTGDLPENIAENTVYYAIVLDTSTIQLASSYTNASLGTPIVFYGGDSLSVVSRVSDKEPNDLGSPIQWDSNRSNWFVHTNASNSIYTECATYGTAQLGSSSNITYIKRSSDSRSIDEKIYKLRVVIPKETLYARDPVEGYVLQDSSSTGVRGASDFTLTSLNAADYAYNRNPRFISTCSVLSNTVTVVSELPHHLNVGDTINVLNVTDTYNTTGVSNSSYNGTFTVAGISSTNDKIFTYSTTDTSGIAHSCGSFTNDVNARTTVLPRFQRNNLQSNYYIYRNEVISPYKYGSDGQDGVYHLYVLNAKNAVPVQFTDAKYSQNVVNLYPQFDRDNLSENPESTSSFALRSPIGEVATNDVQKSITRETADQFIKDFGIGLKINSVTSASGGISTITFDRPHGLSGIATYSSLTPGASYTNGTYYDVKLLNTSSDPTIGTWKGATAKVTVSGAASSVTYAEIMSGGSAYTTGEALFFDRTKIGTGNGSARFNIVTSGITSAVGNSVQITGTGTTSGLYTIIQSIPSTTQVSVATTTGDPTLLSSQYVFITGQSILISSASYSSSSGITTFTFANYHGLLAGNKFRVVDSSNNNLGDYIVNVRNGVTSFNAYTGKQLTSPTYILKHGLSANAAISDATEENVGIRDIAFFANDSLTVVAFTDDTHIRVSAGIATAARFPLGTYIQIDNEILRITSSSLGGTNNDELTVIRGTLGTTKQAHDVGSLIRKINPLPVEFRRPSILRASNQTFEYLGYGPGNYSTSLPQLQVNNLNDTETYLAQSQQKSCGTVVYTGMNNNGDFYIGNKKLSSKTGSEVVFDAPVPTVRGESANALSVIYDEVTVKQRLIVEGGNSNNLLSEFNGPVTFNGFVTINASGATGALNIVGTGNFVNITDSTSTTTGALVIAGGVGIGKNLNVGANVSIGGTLGVTGATTLSSTLSVTAATTLSSTLSVTGVSTFNNSITLVGSNTAATEYFKIQNASAADKFTVDTSSGNTTIVGTLDVTGATTLSSTLGITGNTTITNADLYITNTSTTGGDIIANGGTDGIFTIYNTTNSGSITINVKDNVGTGVNILSLNSSTATITGALNVTGDITAFYTSDQRLKDNIIPIPDALNKVLSISGNTFDWNEKSGKEGTEAGVIAQEILEVLPEAVTTRDNGYLAVHYEKLVPLLIEAIKELKAEIDELKRG